MRRSHAQEALDQTVYSEGSDIQEHIKLLRTCKAAVDNFGTSIMSNETWKGIIIRSIPPTMKWLSVIPSLYAMTSTADIFSTLIAHEMILDRGTQNKSTSGSSNTALFAKTIKQCANPNCKAKKRSTHMTDNCYWPGGGKEGQFPLNFGQRAKANAVSSNHDASDHFVLSAKIPNTPGYSGIVVDDVEIDGHYPVALISKGFQVFSDGKVPTFMDSGASDTMFMLREAFDAYKAMQPRSSDSAKAVNGNFDIIGEGTVIKCYLVDEKEKTITYICAIHTPTLNANLISVSAFDRAGLTITFGDGCGVVCKKDGTVILTARGENEMYVVDDLDGNTPIAMTSLSQPTSLEQWHRCLTHCSPSTIAEMTKNNLVNGLKVFGNEL